MYKSVAIGAHNRNHHSFYEILIRFLIEAKLFVTVYTYKDIYKQVEIDANNRLKVIYFNEGVDLSEEYKTNLAVINGHDVFIFDEYHGNLYKQWLFQIKCSQKIYIIHNLNKWFKLKFTFNLRVLLKNIFKHHFVNRFDALIVVSPVLKRNVLKIFSWRKKVFFIPFSSMDIRQCDVAETKKIVIPGGVDINKRNYDFVLDAFSTFCADFPNTNIKLVLLGSPCGAKDITIIERCKFFNKKFNGKIIYYEQYVPIDVFKAELSSAPYILSNLIVELSLPDNNFEIYGETKETGINYLILNHEKIAIMPHVFESNTGFQDQAFFYNSEHSLIELFKKIENSEIDINSFKVNASKNKKAFNAIIESEKEQLINWLHD